MHHVLMYFTKVKQIYFPDNIINVNTIFTVISSTKIHYIHFKAQRNVYNTQKCNYNVNMLFLKADAYNEIMGNTVNTWYVNAGLM
jgi:hypothetical protein